MSRVFAIAPYEGLKTLIQSIAPEFPELDIHCEIANLMESHELVSQAMAQNYDVIVSRGGTIRAIRSLTSTPVVAIGVSAFDMLNSIALARNYSSKKAVVGFEGITRDFASICKMLNYGIDIYTIDSEDQLPDTLRSLHEQGVDFIIGDVITSQKARQIGMNAQLITSGAESVREALRRVSQMDVFLSRVTAEKRLAESLLEQFAPHLCVLDEKNSVRLCRYPDTVDPAAIVSALSARTVILKGQSRDVLIHRDTAGKYLRAEGNSARLGNEDLYVWRLTSMDIVDERMPSGVNVKNAGEIPLVTTATFPTSNEAFRTLLKRLVVLGQRGRPVLLEGETGVGKTRLAKLVYFCGKRMPIVQVECTNIDTEILPFLERLSIGTDDGFTILWKHLDTLPMDVQQMLAANEALLQRFSHIATAEHAIDDLISAGRFSARLWEQIGFECLSVPPLRERLEDLDNIVELMLGELNERLGRQIIGVTRSAMDFIHKQRWVGNARRLREVLEQAALETDDLYIQRNSLETLCKPNRSNINNYNITNEMTLDDIIREIILYVLRDENMNQVRAARRLGIARTTLWRKIR